VEVVWNLVADSTLRPWTAATIPGLTPSGMALKFLERDATLSGTIKDLPMVEIVIRPPDSFRSGMSSVRVVLSTFGLNLHPDSPWKHSYCLLSHAGLGGVTTWTGRFANP